MRRLPMMMLVMVSALAVASSASAGGVVIAMPPPPPAASAPAVESETPDVGTIALERYGHRRTAPGWNGSDLGFGAWNWGGGWGWRGRWLGSGGGCFPDYPYYGFGGYRISLGQQFFAWRAWNGGYVRPGWACTW